MKIRFLFFLSIPTIMTESWRNRFDLEEQAKRDGSIMMADS